MQKDRSHNLKFVNSNKPVAYLNQATHSGLAIWAKSLHDEVICVQRLKYDPDSTNRGAGKPIMVSNF